eukprot:4256389-Lingulodinium_polyedra.AAC.1
MGVTIVTVGSVVSCVTSIPVWVCGLSDGSAMVLTPSSRICIQMQSSLVAAQSAVFSGVPTTMFGSGARCPLTVV